MKYRFVFVFFLEKKNLKLKYVYNMYVTTVAAVFFKLT